MGFEGRLFHTLRMRYRKGVPLKSRELRILEIETARVRKQWAKDQINNHGSTPALLKDATV